MTTYNSVFTGNVVQPTDVSYVALTLSANTPLFWSFDGNGTEVYAARIMDVTATTTGLSMNMPPANQASVGQDALIRNVGSNTFTVKDYDGNTIISVAAGKAQYIYIQTNATTAGTWGIISFGTGTSSADAASLAGAGLLAISTTLNQAYPVSGFSTGYTFVQGDRSLARMWEGGAGAATLSAAAAMGNNYFFLLKNNGSGTLTISTSGADLIDGLTTRTYQPGDSSLIISTGSGYITVGYGQSISYFFTALTKPVTSGAYTLTSVEAQSIIQEYVGSLTGNVTVTYPPIVNLYVISNQVTANGYTLTVTTGLGTSATIPAGQQATLVCDGTNFFNANTTQAGATALQIVNGTAAAPAINFASEPNTGIYRPGAGLFGISILGSLIAEVTATGLMVTGSGNFTGGIDGGVF
jgi:hypothetical protein